VVVLVKLWRKSERLDGFEDPAPGQAFFGPLFRVIRQVLKTLKFQEKLAG
jgi:hypothetical protein